MNLKVRELRAFLASHIVAVPEDIDNTLDMTAGQSLCTNASLNETLNNT